MKNEPRPNLSHVERGQAVVVWLRNEKKLVKATVRSVRHGDVRTYWRTQSSQHFHTVRRRDEGVTWCFDRDDETARSFQAACVMA